MKQNNMLKTDYDGQDILNEEAAVGRTRIVIRRTFGTKQNLLEIYSEYVAEKILAVNHESRQTERTTA